MLLQHKLQVARTKLLFFGSQKLAYANADVVITQHIPSLHAAMTHAERIACPLSLSTSTTCKCKAKSNTCVLLSAALRQGLLCDQLGQGEADCNIGFWQEDPVRCPDQHNASGHHTHMAGQEGMGRWPHSQVCCSRHGYAEEKKSSKHDCMTERKILVCLLCCFCFVCLLLFASS